MSAGAAAAFLPHGERARASHYGSHQVREAPMHYEIVNLARAAPVDPELDAGAHADSDAIAPGAYATVVLKLPASQAADGRALPRGFYAVLWPLHEEAPEYGSGPRYLGPFASAGQAGEFIRSCAAPW